LLVDNSHLLASLNKVQMGCSQIDVLRSCLTPKAIEEALNYLPPNLHASYGRILSRIGPAQVPLARAALQFIIFARRPPLLVEVAEAAVVGSSDGRFELENRLFDPMEILRMCSSLLVLEEPVTDDSEVDNSLASEDDSVSDTTSVPEKLEMEDWIWKKSRVRPAHYTVSEYLLSARIRTGPANKFAISDETGGQWISSTCLN
jgi:hypothetical protein